MLKVKIAAININQEKLFEIKNHYMLIEQHFTVIYILFYILYNLISHFD